MKSSNGTSWKKVSDSNVNASAWQCMCFGGNYYHGTDEMFFVALATDSNKMIYSSNLSAGDGKSWEKTNNISGGWQSITFSSPLDLYVAVGDAGAVMYGGDPRVKFTSTSTGVPTADYKGVAYGDGKFVAVAEGTVMYSPDGINWTQVTDGITENSNKCIVWGKDKFVTLLLLDMEEM